MSYDNYARQTGPLTTGNTSPGLQLDLFTEQGRKEVLLTVTSNVALTITGKMGGPDDVFGALPHTLDSQTHAIGSKTYILPVNPGCRKFEFFFANASGSTATYTADAGARAS